LLISEYEDGERVFRGHFLDRNRIIAALSDVLVVVDARERSGSLATARHALALGRPVWVTPGAPWDEHTEGSNALLREPEVLAVTSLAVFRDLIAERFSLRGELAAPDPRLDGLQTPRSIDEWRLTQKLDIARACRIMFDLVAAGAVVRLSDGRYVKRR
jgi:DNA processing protein